MAIEVEVEDERFPRLEKGWEQFSTSMEAFGEIVVYLMLSAPATAVGNAQARARTVGRVTYAVTLMATQAIVGTIIGMVMWSALDSMARYLFDRLENDQRALEYLFIAHVVAGVCLGLYIRYFSNVEVDSYRRRLKEFADQYSADDEEWTQKLDHDD